MSTQVITQRDRNYIWLIEHIGAVSLVVLVAFVLVLSTALDPVQTKALIWTILIMGFVFWCKVANDTNRPASHSVIVVARRLIWYHVMLATALFAIYLLVLIVFGEKAKKSINPGLNHPIEAILHVVTSFLGPIFLGIAILCDAHRAGASILAAMTYITWLIAITYKVISYEFSS